MLESFLFFFFWIEIVDKTLCLQSTYTSDEERILCHLIKIKVFWIQSVSFNITHSVMYCRAFANKLSVLLFARKINIKRMGLLFHINRLIFFFINLAFVWAKQRDHMLLLVESREYAKLESTLKFNTSLPADDDGQQIDLLNSLWRFTPLGSFFLCNWIIFAVSCVGKCQRSICSIYSSTHAKYFTRTQVVSVIRNKRNMPLPVSSWFECK